MWWRQSLGSTHCVFRMQPVHRTSVGLIRQRYARQGAGLRLMQIYWWQQSLKGTDRQFIDNQAPQPTPASLGSWLVHRQQLEYLSLLVVINPLPNFFVKISFLLLNIPRCKQSLIMTEEYRLVKDSVYGYVQVSKTFAFWLKIRFIYDLVMNASILAKAKGCLKIKIIYMVATFPRPLSTLHGMGKSHQFKVHHMFKICEMPVS